MARIAAVGIDNDLASGESSISVWATDYEEASRVDVANDVAGNQLCDFCKHRCEEVLFNNGLDIIEGEVLIMLC